MLARPALAVAVAVGLASCLAALTIAGPTALGRPSPAGTHRIVIQLGPTDQTTLLDAGNLAARFRSDRRRRVRVSFFFLPSIGPSVGLSASQLASLPAGRWRRISAALSPSGRSLLARCTPGDLQVRVTGTGLIPLAARTPLVAKPPSCGRFFAPSTFWNAPLTPNAALDANSAEVTADLLRQVQAGYSGGLQPTINTTAYTPPIYTVPVSQPHVGVHLDEPPDYDPALAADFASVPLPPDARPAAGSDEELVVWQPATDTLWEFWLLHRTRDGWHARWGGRLDHVSTGPGLFTGTESHWGTSATSLPLVGGLITPQELAAGAIKHILALAIPAARASAYSLPAQRTDGSSPCPNAVPEGARFRLDPALNVASLGLAPPVATLARAAQQYGIVVRDQSAAVTFYAQNAASLPSDPYPALFGGAAPSALLQSFPWSHLQLTTMSLVPVRSGPLPGLLQLLGGCS